MILERPLRKKNEQVLPSFLCCLPGRFCRLPCYYLVVVVSVYRTEVVALRSNLSLLLSTLLSRAVTGMHQGNAATAELNLNSSFFLSS